MRFKADVGAFIRWQGRRGCADDLVTLDTPWVLAANMDSVSSSLVVKLSLATASAILFFFWCGLCRPEVSLWYASNLILGFIHSEIVMIYFIPLLCHFYLLQIFLATSETKITMMVATIMMMMMLREYAVMKAGSRWALAMMRSSVKNAQPEPVSTTDGWVSLVILTVDIR